MRRELAVETGDDIPVVHPPYVVGAASALVDFSGDVSAILAAIDYVGANCGAIEPLDVSRDHGSIIAERASGNCN